MSSYLRQSTASQSRAIGPFLDDTDFKTAETGLTIANTDIKLLANGGASANKNSGGGTHRANGVYGVTFDATDTATVGELFVSVVASGALPVFHTFTILEEAVYDALFAAAAPGYVANAPVNVAQFGGTNGTFAAGRPEVNTTHLGGTAQTARDVGASVLLSNGTGTGQVTLTSGRVNADLTHVAGTAWASTTLFTLASHDPGATIGTSTLTQTQVTGGTYALNSASFAFNAAVPLTTQMKADVTAAVPTAASVWAAGTRTLTEIDSTIFTDLVRADVFAVQDDAITGSAVAVSAVDKVQTGLATAASVAALNNLSAAQVNAEVDTAIADVGLTTARTGYLNNINNINLANVPAFPANFATLSINASGHVSRVTLVDTATTVTNQLTAAAIATGVWQDATAGDFTTANSIGKSLYNAFTANTSVYTVAALANAPTGGSAPTAAAIATAVWQDTTAGDFTVANSIGKSLYTAGNAPGAASGLALVGSNVGTATSVSGSVASVTNPVTVGTNNDKTGYELTQTFPANFSALDINASGHVSRVVLCDTITTYTGNTVQTGDAFARIGATGSGLTSLASAANLATVAGYLDTEIADIQSRLPAALVGGKMDSTLDTPERMEIGVKVWDTLTRTLTGNDNLAIPTANDNATAVWANGTRTLTSGANIALAKGAGVTGFNDLSAAQVNAEVDAALADVGLTTTVTGRIDAAVTSRMASYTQPTGFLTATFPATVASPTNITAGTMTTVASVTNPVTVGTNNDKTGYALTAAYDPAKTASQFNAAVDSVSLSSGSGSALVVATTAAVAAQVTSDHGAGSYARNTEPPAADDVAAAVWDLSTAGHMTAGTFGAALAAAGSAGDPWITSLPGSYAEGTAGFMLGNQALQTGDSYARLGAPATTSIAADIAAIDTGGDFNEAILTVTPDSRLVDSAGNPVTSVSVAQALAALFVNMLGDRSGIQTRRITAALPGTANCTISATRTSASTIEATIVLPASP